MRPEKSSTSSTFFNIFITFVGSGLLALPSGVKDAGFVAGIVGIVFFWGIFNYTAIIIIRCKHLALNAYARMSQNAADDLGGDFYYWSDPSAESEVSYLTDDGEPVSVPRGQQTIRSFVDVCEAAFGGMGRRVMQVTLVITQIGFCCVYLIFVTRTVQELSAGTAPAPHNSTSHLMAGLDDLTPPAELSRWVCMLFFVWVLVLLSWLPSLKFLAPSSIFGNVSVVAACGLILSVGLLSPTVQASISWPWDLPAIQLDTMPLFFGIVGFAYSIHGVVVDFESEMEHPHMFNKTVTAASFLVMLLYVAIGGLCYMYFGEATKEAVTDNLDAVTEIPEWIVDAVKICLSLSLCCTYPVQLTPVIHLLEHKFLKRSSHWLSKYLLRTTVVLFTAIIAQLVPFFGLFASLVGGLGSVLQAVIFPCLCYLKLGWPKLGVSSILLNVGVILVGLAVVSFTTVETVKSLAQCFGDPDLASCQ